MTLAAIDRLVHHSTILEMNVERYRRRAALDRKRGRGRAPNPRDNLSENWAERAAGLDLDAMALFGCAPKRPLDYSGSAGLLWAINGGRLVELHRDWAVIDLPVNRSQRIFYRRNVDPAKITLPWV